MVRARESVVVVNGGATVQLKRMLAFAHEAKPIKQSPRSLVSGINAGANLRGTQVIEQMANKPFAAFRGEAARPISSGHNITNIGNACRNNRCLKRAKPNGFAAQSNDPIKPSFGAPDRGTAVELLVASHQCRNSLRGMLRDVRIEARVGDHWKEQRRVTRAQWLNFQTLGLDVQRHAP